MKTPKVTSIEREVALRPKSMDKFMHELDHLFEEVRMRAFELFEERGRKDGFDVDDWLKAEMELIEPVKVEVSDKEGKLLIRAEVKGFKPDEIEVNLEPEVLTIKAEHTRETENKEKGVEYTESSAKSIFRRIHLPATVSLKNAKAVLKGGMLEISAPTAEEAERKLVVAAA